MLSVLLAMAGIVALVVAGWLIHVSIGLAVLGLALVHAARSTFPAPEVPS